jgi:hypothetical protein
MSDVVRVSDKNEDEEKHLSFDDEAKRFSFW